MSDFKISQLDELDNLSDADLLEISKAVIGGYASRKLQALSMRRYADFIRVKTTDSNYDIQSSDYYGMVLVGVELGDFVDFGASVSIIASGQMNLGATMIVAASGQINLGASISLTFSPIELSPLGWWAAYKESFNDDDAVGTATDWSGNTNHATQSTTNAKPTFKTNVVNGKPVFRFDGNDLLNVPINQSRSTFTVYIVTAINDYVNDAGIYGPSIADSNGFAITLWSETSIDSFTYGPNVGLGGARASQAVGVFGLFELSYSGSIAQLHYNGTLIQQKSDSGTVRASSNMCIGAAHGRYLIGDTPEVLDFGTFHNAEQRASMRTYFSNEYNITIA